MADVSLARLAADPDVARCALAPVKGTECEGRRCSDGPLVLVAGQRLCRAHAAAVESLTASRAAQERRDRLDPAGAAKRAAAREALARQWAEVEAYVEDQRWMKRRRDRDRWREKVQARGGSRAVLTPEQYRQKLDRHNARRQARKRGQPIPRPEPMTYLDKRVQTRDCKRRKGARPYTRTTRSAPCPMPGCGETMHYATKRPTRCDACWLKLEPDRTATRRSA